MVLELRTWPATPATQAASTPRTTKAPAPPLASGPGPSSAEALEAPRVSGGRRVTALIAPGIGTRLRRLEPGGASPLGPPPAEPLYVKVSRYQSTIASPANRPTRLPSASHGPNGTPFLRPSFAP